MLSRPILDTGSRWVVAEGKCKRRQVAAGLVYGQVKKSSRRRKLVRGTHRKRVRASADVKVARPRIRLLGTAEHRFYRAGSPGGPSWRLGPGTPPLGDGEACPTPAGSSAMVACLLPFCTDPRIITHTARTAAR